ncbi:MAG: heavy-metal-associated domain-containing protein [Rhodospirillales bacterium]|nr:heavy-metal-associated domain-containing protein [Rhodospirillales bacterium]
MTRTYRVTGMTCEGCVRSVERALARVAPGARVSVDLATGRVSIENGPEETLVASAVTEAGFGFERVG